MNHLVMIGRLTKDPKVRYTQSENPLCVSNFILAVPRRGSNEESDFFNCVAFGKNGEFAEKYLKKGMKMGIHGHLRSSSRTNEDGSNSYYVNVVVDEFEFAQSRQENGQAQESEVAENDFVSVREGSFEELPFM